MLEAEALRDEAEQLEEEAALLAERVRAMRVEAGKLRARAERCDNPALEVRITHTAMDRVRGDGLLAAAGVAVEDLQAGFTASDLAGALGIRDEARAMRLLLAVAELGHAARLPTGGWVCLSDDEQIVREFVIEAGVFTAADVIDLGYTQDETARFIEAFRSRGIIEGEGGHYSYVEPDGPTPARERRRPPELDPPAGTERRAKGEAVHVVNHGQRGKQMQGGNRRHVIRRDQNRERAIQERERKQAERIAAQAASRNERGVRRK